MFLIPFLLINGFMSGLGWTEVDRWEAKKDCRNKQSKGLAIACGEWDEIDQCNSCPKFPGCEIKEPAPDGCNIQTRHVWCEKGQWYDGGVVSVTLAMCEKPPLKIDNPFR